MYNSVKKPFAAFLSLLFLMQQLIFIPAFATDITGITGASGVYDINPASASGQTGFRQYTNFDLSQGDIANLIFKYGADNVSRFVNLVDNQININGIVNTMRDSSFYNGHAIFVSPNGMVVGASGVLNVGSLTALTPSSSLYNTMKSGGAGYWGDADFTSHLSSAKNDSQGDITVNGKIIARGDVGLYGSNVKIGSNISGSETSSDTSGIVAGLGSDTTKLDTLAQADTLFYSLVNTSKTNANNLNLENGKIVIKANSERSTIAASPLNGSTVTATVDVNNASLLGNDIEVVANASDTVNTQVNLLTTALLDIFDSQGENFLTEYFSTNPYPLFDGARASAIVNVANANILSKGNVLIGSSANAVMNVNSEVLGGVLPNFLYAIGTKTISEVNINSGANIQSTGDVGLVAFSTNGSEVSIANGSLLTQNAIDAIQFTMVNSSTSAATKSKVNQGSTINSNNLTVSAVNSSSSEIEVSNTASVGDNELGTDDGSGNKTGGSGVSVSVILKNENIDTSATIESENVSTNENTNIVAQNLHIATNRAEAETDDGDYKTDTNGDGKVGEKDANGNGTIENSEKDKKEGSSTIKDYASKIDEYTQQKSILSKIQKILSNTSKPSTTDGSVSGSQSGAGNANQSVTDTSGNTETESALAQLSGSLVINTSNITTTAKASNAANINAGQDVNIYANAVDLTSNKATTESTGAAKIGAGVAVIVNSQTNNTTAEIENSTVTAQNVNLKATTELPMNSGELKLSFELPFLNDSFSIGLGVDSSSDGMWDLSMLDLFKEQNDEISYTLGTTDSSGGSGSSSGLPISFSIDESLGDMLDDTKPSFEWESFFNNFAQATASGENAGVSGSVIYNAINNNTSALITQNSNVTASGGDVSLNSVNSVVNYNAVGMVDFLVKLVDRTISGGDDQLISVKSGKAGLGGSVLINSYNNNADSEINSGSTVTSDGTVGLYSASEQAYLSAAATGAQGGTFALTGSVIVQNIEGNTTSKIDDAVISAADLEVNAGKATFAESNKEIDSATGLIDFEDERDAHDKISNIVLGGALAAQRGESNAQSSSGSSSGAAVGASVNVTNINRSVNASIENGSDITATNSINVLADNKLQSINIAVAGAFAGGVSMDKTKQESANGGSTDDSSTNGSQGFGNFGGWLDKLKSVVDIFSSATDNAKSSSQDATGQSVTDQLADTDTQDALNKPISVTEKEVERNADGTVKTDTNGDPVYKDTVKTYTPDSSGVYKDADGNTLYEKDGSGHWVAKTASPSDKDAASNLAGQNGSLTGQSNTADSTTSQSNFSLAAAGSVNVNVNTTEVAANITGSTVKVGNSLNVSATQETNTFDLAGGVAKAGSVGAGAGVNVNYKGGSTTALIQDSDVKFTSSDDDKSLTVLADEYNRTIDVAVGLGVASGGSGSGTKAAVGGSFNVNVVGNEVESSLLNTTIANDTDMTEGIDVNVYANNYTEAYKGAGGVSVTKGNGSSAGLGAGIAANINVFAKSTKAQIQDSTISDAKNVDVEVNNRTDKDFAAIKTDDIISAAAAGAIVAGSSSSYSFSGAIGTDVIANTISANIQSSDIDAAESVAVNANSSIRDVNINGAISFSTASSGVGVGLGTVVSVISNDISSTIEDSTISNSSSIDINSLSEEELKYLAINLGIQTGGGIPITVNAIVSVLASQIASSVINSDLTTSGDVNITSTYDNSNQGITLVGTGTSSGSVSFGGNIIANIYANAASVNVDEDSEIASGGDVNIEASSSEYINVIPLTVSASASGTVAAAANIAANIIINSTMAEMLGSITDSSSVTVKASDVSTMYNRGGTIAATGGSAGVGGSVLVDVIVKDVEARTGSGSVSSDGNVTVRANSENSFGGTKDSNGDYIVTNIGTADSLISSLASSDLEDIVSLLNWQMTFDAAGGNSAGVSGSLITKVLKSTVIAEVAGTNIDAGSLDVLADDYVIINAIVGNITGGGTAAVGGSAFINVAIGSTTAKIADDSVIDTDNDINVEANSTEVIRNITVVGGGAGTVAVNGAATVNVVKDSTQALIGNDVEITNAQNINVVADKDTDVQTIGVSVSASGTVSVGGILYSNTFLNDTTAQIGTSGLASTKTISATGDILVSADADEAFSASIASIAGSGAAAVSGVALANVIASTVNANVYGSNVSTSAGKMEVLASHGYNAAKASKTLNFATWINNNRDSAISASNVTDLLPLTVALNIAGSGAAAISGTVVSNVIASDVSAYVENSTISTANGLTVKAYSSDTTFDAVAGVSGSAYASIAVNGVANVIVSETKSEINNSEITSGNAKVESQEDLNLNTVIFTVAAAGVGASIAGVINSNTIVNDVIAKMVDTDILNGNTTANAFNTVQINNLLIAGSGIGIGASINLVPIVNVFVGDTSASIQGGTISKGITSVYSKNDIDTLGLIAGAAGSGIGADVSGYVITNVFDNDQAAYISGTTILNGTSTDTKAESFLTMTGVIASGGVTGIGASVLLNGIVSVINNNINAYIKDSSITSGSVGTNAKQDTDIIDVTASASVTGIGNTSAANTVVHVFNNHLNSYIDNTSMTNVGDIIVKATSSEDISSNNVGISGSGTSAVSGNVIVNVLEGETNAYLHAKDKTITSTGKIDINASDITTLRNIMGLVVASGGLSAGFAVDVNIINNAVKSELLSNASGSITASEVDVHSDSTLELDISTVSAAFGALGLAGTVGITSVGSKFDSSDKDSSMNTSGAVSKANSNYDGLYDKKTYNNSGDKSQGSTTTQGEFTYEKDGSSKTTANAFNLTTGTAKDGTVANINANVTATGANGIKSRAENTLKGIGSDASAQLTNAAVSGGIISAGASVLVTDMKYHTVAEISGGNVRANNGNVEVKADSTVKANTDAVAATIAAVSIAGNASYFKNSANTEAEILDATVYSSSKVSVIANSIDDIVTTAISGSAGLASITVNLAIAETNNNTKAHISGDVDITANDLDVTSSISSNLESELYALTIAGVSVGAVINSAKSYAVTDAIVDATGDIRVDDEMNVIAYNKGISAKNTMYAGTLAFYSGSVSVQGATIDADFNAKIDNTDLNVTSSDGNYANKISVLSGVNADKTTAGTLTTEIVSKSASIGLVSAHATYQNATVSSDSTAKVNAKSLKTKTLNVASKLTRTARTGSVSGSIGAVTVGALQLNSVINGTSNIELGGNIAVQNAINIALNDTANATSKMLSADLSIGSVAVNQIISDIDTDSTITLGGIINAGNMDIDSVVNRNSYATAKSDSLGLVSIHSMTMRSKTLGDSTINYNATSNIDGFANAIDISSVATNTTQSYMSDHSVALAALARGLTTNTLNTNNTIKFTNANITSTGDVKANVENNNQLAMTKDSSSSGFIVIKGGSLNNDVDSHSKIQIDNSIINARDISMTSKTAIANVSGTKMYYDDDSSGFITSSGAELSNSVSQSNLIDIKGGSKLTASRNLLLSTIANATLAQYVKSDSSGAGCYNEANSYLTVTNDSDINISGSGTAVTAAVNANIAMDSNNTLESKAKVEAHHFAGQPGAESRLTANIYNDFTVDTGSSFNAGENINVNFMANSVNKLTQYAYAYAEAAVASADYSGGIVFNNKNTMTVNSGGLVSSLKNVFINYKNGSNTLDSTIAYKKVSRLLFGIPITKSGSRSNVTSTSLNKLVNNGTIEAGRAGQRILYINPDGSINEAESSGFTSADYTKTSSTGLTSAEATQQAIDNINENITAINEKLAELDSDETKNNEAITEFTALKNKFQAILDAFNASGTMTVAQVNATMADVIDNYAYSADATHNYVSASSYYGSSDGGGLKSQTTYSNNTHLDSTTFTTLWNQILTADSDGNDSTTIDTVLAAYTYNASYTVTTTNYKTDGSVDSTSSSTQTLARGLTGDQISSIKNAWTSEQSKLQSNQQVASSDIVLSKYNGQYIFTDDTEKTDTITNVSNSVSSYDGFIANLNTLNSDISSSRTALNANKSSLSGEIANLTSNPLPAVTVSDPTFIFKNITMEPAKIQITGLQLLNGSGEFKTYDRGLTIDNYSNYDLIFNNIIFDTAGTGLTINGTAYNDAGKVMWMPAYHNVQRTYDTTGDGNIHISTYFDHNNPLDTISRAANIFLNGYIRNTVANKYIDVFNDSGNITFDNVVDAAIRNIIASQGNIIFDDNSGNVILRSDGHIIAGQDISIKAATLTNNGAIKAGNADRNIVIDDTLYNSLTLDSNGVNNMSKTLKSTYLNGTNNIKAIRDEDGNIHIYNTDATSGSITVNATTKNGSGTYTYSDGYGTVSITNNTNHNVIVHNLTNNYEAGTISGVSGTKLASNTASTSITSNNSEVELRELLSSGNNGTGDTGSGTVTILAKAVSVPDRIVSASQQPNVDVTGTFSSTSTNGTSVLGWIKNRKGNTTIANNTAGDLTIGATGKVENQNGTLTLSNSGTGKIETVAGSTLTNVGTLALTNGGSGGIQHAGSATNTGATNITNTNGLLNVASTGTITNSTGNVTFNNSGSQIKIAGTVTNNVSGNTTITNTGANGIEISGNVTNANGTTDINNNSTESTSGVKITSTGKVQNAGGTLTLDNKGGKLIVEKVASAIGLVKNTNGDIALKNTGNGIEIQGDVQNLTPSGTARTLAVTNTGGSEGLLVSGNVTNAKGAVTLTNTAGDLNIASTGIVTNSTGTLTLSNSGDGAINIAGTTNNNVSGNTIVTNSGANGIEISGSVNNTNGLINVNNTNTSATSGINLTTTGRITDTTGNITVENEGMLGIIVKGIIQAINNDISLIADNSDIVIGEYASNNDNYVNAQNGNVTVTIDTGSLLNGVVDTDTTTQNAYHDLGNIDKAYKTLIKSARNLTVNVEDGDIGRTANAKPGFSINASTRDYTESVNVNVGGSITASAANGSLSDERLINIRSKDSDMKVNSITADGNIMLTAADWKQADSNPAPALSNTAYYKGYSILNANSDKTQPNVKGKNISLIASDKLGEAGNAFNYEQTDIGVDSWLSFEAENDVNINNTGTLGSNIWQAISKNGSMDFVLNGENTTIRTITAGKNLHITDKGKNLTIYNLGMIDTIGNDLDDMLYPHDQITLQGSTGRAVPETVKIEVLDANGGDNANSTLNIFNAFVKGIGSSTQADVIIRADNFIAHAYDAPDSSINTATRTGFNDTEDRKAERLYSDNPLDTTATKDLEATGFHSYGNGSTLNFDLRGVYPSLVQQYTGSSLTRTYYEQPVITTLVVFTNPLYIPGTDYKMKDATLSYNQDDASLENRGLTLRHLYSNNAYINSNDLNFNIDDAIITNYAEFRNGNRGVAPHDGRVDYRWKTIVDNDYRRLLILDTYVTLQLYTALTGSFGLEMGDLIVMQTMAPPVHYNPYEVTNLPRNENSFYRQTYKDDKIQEKTTTPEFKDIDKATDSHTKRESIRFESQEVLVNAKDSSAQVFNISKTGMEIQNTANAKVGDVIPLDINIGSVNIKAQGQVMRAENGRIGVKFINMDKATSNKILYLNMLSTNR